MRIQRALARAGVASRREAERFVADGRVTINDRVAEIGQQVDPARDRICVDGAPIAAPRTDVTWMVLHKPSGVMTTRRDPQGRQTVFDLVQDEPGLVYVGRLDLLTEGVLLLTTDGKAAHTLTHPSHEVERTYVAIVRGDAPQAVRDARRGVELEDGPVFPVAASCEPLGERRWAFEITLGDGRTREVRRLCEALGLEVERLVRTQYGPVQLGEMPVGTVRPLTAQERKAMARLVEDE
jgi:23S rRNA pseudouridine2605 synthase